MQPRTEARPRPAPHNPRANGALQARITDRVRAGRGSWVELQELTADLPELRKAIRQLVDDGLIAHLDTERRWVMASSFVDGADAAPTSEAVTGPEGDAPIPSPVEPPTSVEPSGSVGGNASSPPDSGATAERGPSQPLKLQGGVGRSPRADQVAELLRKHPRGVAVRDLASELAAVEGCDDEWARNSVRVALQTLQGDGRARWNGKGRKLSRWFPTTQLLREQADDVPSNVVPSVEAPDPAPSELQSEDDSEPCPLCDCSRGGHVKGCKNYPGSGHAVADDAGGDGPPASRPNPECGSCHGEGVDDYSGGPFACSECWPGGDRGHAFVASGVTTSANGQELCDECGLDEDDPVHVVGDPEVDDEAFLAAMEACVVREAPEVHHGPNDSDEMRALREQVRGLEVMACNLTSAFAALQDQLVGNLAELAGKVVVLERDFGKAMWTGAMRALSERVVELEREVKRADRDVKPSNDAELAAFREREAVCVWLVARDLHIHAGFVGAGKHRP